MKLGNDMFCTICDLTPVGSGPCPLCKREDSPERGGRIGLPEWLKSRNLNVRTENDDVEYENGAV